MNTRLALAATLASLSLAPGVMTPSAHAQSSSNPAALAAPGFSPSQHKGKGQAPGEKAPPALPGSRAEPTAVAPASKSTADMPPTEALFDSINRGDLATAKDAVNRGADINGTNVLGLTPLELSVDLGRNEISFLLLSLRGGAGYTTSAGPGKSAAPAAPSRAERLASDRAERAERAAQLRSARAAPAQPAAPQSARLFAGNGGAPIPQAGFLGFDARR